MKRAFTKRCRRLLETFDHSIGMINTTPSTLALFAAVS